MAKNLHPSILPYWERALDGQSNVKSWSRVSDPSDYIYHIERVHAGDIYVLVSDSYRYGLTDFFTRNDSIEQGSMIYMARPESNYSLEVADAAKDEMISIGMLGEILGALNIDKHWEWESQVRKERRKN